MDRKRKYAHIQDKLDSISENTPTSYERLQEAYRRFEQIIPKLWLVARRNTVKNNDGLTVLTKDSPYRKECGWESDIKKEWVK